MHSDKYVRFLCLLLLLLLLFVVVVVIIMIRAEARSSTTRGTCSSHRRPSLARSLVKPMLPIIIHDDDDRYDNMSTQCL